MAFQVMPCAANGRFALAISHLFVPGIVPSAARLLSMPDGATS
ncbi:hypothetical protein Rumeso_01406 [Rubellimicrobium mesophilum DSM 19309]|uniref:Uncharacterized protein n=1 Tax=Rubellimicrobium mesophilum DSM 19309 TaxID=442562 RepID=A0A017HRR1_9RHOB|nr:hypothetical protein [Rubellimicrobium mesophilum]EYD77031.1 hypothetical protein Rumeso_01406 [Rubellimicrobium mesophilum DSM 19309]